MACRVAFRRSSYCNTRGAGHLANKGRKLASGTSIASTIRESDQERLSVMARVCRDSTLQILSAVVMHPGRGSGSHPGLMRVLVCAATFLL